MYTTMWTLIYDMILFTFWAWYYDNVLYINRGSGNSWFFFLPPWTSSTKQTSNFNLEEENSNGNIILNTAVLELQNTIKSQ
jgi:hypothetical protein